MSILGTLAGLFVGKQEILECPTHRVPTVEVRHGDTTERVCEECTRLKRVRNGGEMAESFQEQFDRTRAQTAKLVELVAEQQKEKEREALVTRVGTQIDPEPAEKSTVRTIEETLSAFWANRAPQPEAINMPLSSAAALGVDVSAAPAGSIAVVKRDAVYFVMGDEVCNSTTQNAQQSKDDSQLSSKTPDTAKPKESKSAKKKTTSKKSANR